MGSRGRTLRRSKPPTRGTDVSAERSGGGIWRCRVRGGVLVTRPLWWTESVSRREPWGASRAPPPRPETALPMMLCLLAFDAMEAGRLTPPGESFSARRLGLPDGALAELRNAFCRPGIRPNKKRAGPPLEEPAHRSGNDLLSHRVSPAVPSALEGLTSEFGMGSGVTPPQ